MNARTLVETWLSKAALPADLPRTLDPDGFWSMPYGRTTLTLAVPENQSFFVLYAPLMSVADGTAERLAAFYHELLTLQLRGELPVGMAFGMDVEDPLVSIVGQYPLSGLNPTAFDRLMHEAAAASEALRDKLENLFADLSPDNAVESGDAPERRRPSAALDLSDQELLRTQMAQALRF